MVNLIGRYHYTAIDNPFHFKILFPYFFDKCTNPKSLAFWLKCFLLLVSTSSILQPLVLLLLADANFKFSDEIIIAKILLQIVLRKVTTCKPNFFVDSSFFRSITFTFYHSFEYLLLQLDSISAHGYFK